MANSRLFVVSSLNTKRITEEAPGTEASSEFAASVGQGTIVGSSRCFIEAVVLCQGACSAWRPLHWSVH